MSDLFQKRQEHAGILSYNRCGWNSLSVWKGQSDFCFASRIWNVSFNLQWLRFFDNPNQVFKENTSALGVRAKYVRKKITPLLVCMHATMFQCTYRTYVQVQACVCVCTVCTLWANSLKDPKLVIPGTGPPIWGKYNPSSPLTLRLNKGKLRCPSRKSLYENKSCSVPHSGACNHRLQGTNKMTFHTAIGPTVSIWSPSCCSVGDFFCIPAVWHFSLRLSTWSLLTQVYNSHITHQHEIILTQMENYEWVCKTKCY